MAVARCSACDSCGMACEVKGCEMPCCNSCNIYSHMLAGVKGKGEVSKNKKKNKKKHVGLVAEPQPLMQGSRELLVCVRP
jgi:hypothetical protein